VHSAIDIHTAAAATVASQEHLRVLTFPTAAPDPATDEYTRLVWLWHRHACGALARRWRQELEALPEPVQALRDDPWVRRYLECARRDAAGLELGGAGRTAWLSRQRRARESGSLPSGRVALLHRLRGFTWTPDADQWEAAFNQVRRFVGVHGRLPSRGDDAMLSGWLAAQRFALRRGQLSPRRVEVLEALPGWSGSMSCSRSHTVWERHLATTRTFLDMHGRYPSSAADSAAENAAGRWVDAQRTHYRRGDLSSQRTEALSALPGWRWSAREADFDARVDQLCAELSGSAIATDHPLYGWVVAQRRRHRDGRLPAEQVAVLHSMNLLDESLQRVT
jgi:hypothetical protein